MRLLPRSPSGWTMAVFGVLAALLGAVGLLAPDALLAVMGFEAVPRGRRADGDHTAVFVTASSMAAVNMGVYYVLAALSDWKAFFRWTVPFRLLTCAVFTLAVVSGRAPAGFLGVGLWEGAGALVTAAALRREGRGARTAPAGVLPSPLSDPAAQDPGSRHEVRAVARSARGSSAATVLGRAGPDRPRGG